MDTLLLPTYTKKFAKNLETKIKITEWFEDTNPEHVLAFAEYMIMNEFPKGFLPDDIQYDEDWDMIIMSQLAANYALCVAAKEGRTDYLMALAEAKDKPTLN